MQIVLIALWVIYFAPIGTKTTITTTDRKPWCEIAADQSKRNSTYQSRKDCYLLCDNDLFELQTKSKKE